MFDTAALDATPSVWHEQSVNNNRAVQDFYTRLFGWTTTDVDMGPMGAYTLFRQNNDNLGGIVRMTGPEWDGMPPHWSVYVQVDNVDRRAKKAEEARRQSMRASIRYSAHWPRLHCSRSGRRFVLPLRTESRCTVR